MRADTVKEAWLQFIISSTFYKRWPVFSLPEQLNHSQLLTTKAFFRPDYVCWRPQAIAYRAVASITEEDLHLLHEGNDNSPFAWQISPCTFAGYQYSGSSHHKMGSACGTSGQWPDVVVIWPQTQPLHNNEGIVPLMWQMSIQSCNVCPSCTALNCCNQSSKYFNTVMEMDFQPKLKRKTALNMLIFNFPS